MANLVNILENSIAINPTVLEQSPSALIFGPTPDEAITMILDRLLYYGGRRLLQTFGLDTTSDCETESTCSNQTPCQKDSESDCCKQANKSCCTDTPRQRSAYVDFADGVKCDKRQTPTVGQRLKNSLSLCSLACRRLKSKATSNAEALKTKLFWTQLKTQNNGCKVYEVYQDRKMPKDPTCNRSSGPIIIIVVLPNGSIMPFESMS